MGKQKKEMNGEENRSIINLVEGTTNWGMDLVGQKLDGIDQGITPEEANKPLSTNPRKRKVKSSLQI